MTVMTKPNKRSVKKSTPEPVVATTATPVILQAKKKSKAKKKDK